VRLSLRSGAAAFGFTIVTAFHAAAAGVVAEDVPVSGGTEAMAQALGVSPPPDRARFVVELARLTHPAAETKHTTRGNAAAMLARADATGPRSADAVPIPLTAAVWSQAIFRRPVSPEHVVAAILSDPRAAHLCYGLAGLDDETLQFFVDHPALLTDLYERSAATFAAFGGAVRVHEDRIDPPGGPVAAALWEAVVGERVDRPEGFLRALFRRDQGRVAYLFETIAGLDEPRARFALGLWISDPELRLQRFKALAALSRSAFPQWQPTKLPFSRPLHDIASMLARVRAEPDGAPMRPAARTIWTRIFDGVELLSDPDPPAPSGRPADGTLIDAAWLAERIAWADPPVRAERLDQVAFGQRVFAAADATAAPDVLRAIRALPRYRMLMLALEQMGVRQASSYAAAVRRAQQLSALDGRRGLIALAQFQGTLALISRLASVHALDASACEALTVELATLMPNSGGWYAGAMAEWIQDRLVSRSSRPTPEPRAGGRSESHAGLEAAMARALAGAPATARPPTRLLWEGHWYRLDLAASEERRLRHIRDRQGGPTLDVAVALARAARMLATDAFGVSQSAPIQSMLDAIRRDITAAPSDDRRRAAQAVADHATQVLAKLARVGPDGDVREALQLARPLAELADELLADALKGWVYAISIADPDSPVLLTANVVRRHDLGRSPAGGVRADVEWALPRPATAAGVPWHVAGSLVGLDVALAALSLRRIDGDRVIDPPTLSANERETFAASVALLNPFALHDRDRDVIAQSIVAGRQRVGLLTEDASAVDRIATEIRMDGWRRRALRWTIANEPARVASMFSMTELLLLGGASLTDLSAWGMSALASSGCLCTELAPPSRWRTLLGRPQVGLMATTVADLHLQVAVILRELGLPAAIAKSVLAAAIQDFIDEVRPTDANDWLSLVRAAQRVSRERIEDYVSAVTAHGPLVYDAAAGASAQP
jgi:hypothetical protein